MKLKKWPTNEFDYLKAIRDINKFTSLFESTHQNPSKFDDYKEATEIYKKLISEICQKYNLISIEQFWKWCYRIASLQIEILEDKIISITLTTSE